METINIGNAIVNNYILKIPDGYLAIDTGYPGGFDRYCNGLKKHSINLSDIKLIFLTHVHDDHVGFLSELMRATNAKVIVHKQSPERLMVGHNKWIGGCTTVLARVFVSCMFLAGKNKHVFSPVDLGDNIIIWNGNTQQLKEQGIPLMILPLPGHTADSIGLLSDDGELFCGDAAMNGFPSYKRNIICIENMKNYMNSWNTMIKCKAKIIYPSHGRAFPAKDLVRFQNFLSKITLR